MPNGRILIGDCRKLLPILPPESVHCYVTSPPYWGLRSYLPAGHDDKHHEIGSEATPEEWIATLVEVFREVRRVLRPDGTLWLNVGDSYSLGVGMARGQAYQRHAPQKSGLWAGTAMAKRDIGNNGVVHNGAGYKPKDLMMLPARLALALQADGWWLRSDIIWAKPTPMPESVTDRPTSAHEHVFMFAKRPKYFFDAEAVREDSEMRPQNRFTNGRGDKDEGYAAHRRAPGMTASNGRNLRNVWTFATAPFPKAHFATFPPKLAEICIKASCPVGGTVLDPFFGAGTTGLVAHRLNRNTVGIELSKSYCEMALRRLREDNHGQKSGVRGTNRARVA